MLLSLLLFFVSLSFSSTNITILHTNDLHSYFQGTLKKEKDLVTRVGGYDYLASEFLSTKKSLLNNGEDFVLAFDAGDFYSGTIYHSIALLAENAFFPEYEFFNYLQYDAITLGNHEFDGGDSGFNIMMGKVQKLGNKVPIVSTNFYRNDNREYPILKSKILNLKNKNKKLTVGVLGALGPDGCSVSKASRVQNKFIGYDDKKHKERWNDLNELLQKEAEKLKLHGADLVILVLHGGSKEDDLIGKKVNGVDIIIAGHTHEVYQKEVNGKIISQAGSYGRFLGVLPIILNEGKLSLREPIKEIGSYHHPIDRNQNPDENYSKTMAIYKRAVGRTIRLNQFPNQDTFSFSVGDDLSREKTGELVSSSILKELRKEGEDIDFYFSALGLIRNPLYGNYNYTLEDMFNILPIGFHDGNKLGYKVVSFYLTKRDVKQLIGFLNTYSYFSGKAKPVFSDSLKVTYRKWGIPLINKIKKIQLNGQELPEKVRVATNTFLFEYLDFIEKKTFGMVKIEPLDEEGKPIKLPIFHRSEVSYFLNGLD